MRQKRASLLHILLVLGLFMLTTSGCAVHAPQVVEQSLDSYGYVHLNENSRYKEMIPEIKVLFTGLGFRVVSNGQIKNLTDQEKEQVLSLYLTVTSDEETSQAEVRLVDFLSGRMVYTGLGTGDVYDEMQRNRVLALRRSLSDVFGSYVGPTISRENVQTAEVPRESSDAEHESEEGVKQVKDQVESEEWENISKTRKELIKYFDRKAYNLDSVEGIWTDDTNRHTLAIFEDKKPAQRDYVGIMLNEDEPGWKICDVKMEIKATASTGAYTATFYLHDRTSLGGVMEIGSDDRLHGTFKSGEETRKITFLRNYPENFSPRDTEEKSGPLAYGTGFLLDRSGLVVTNYHVVDDPGQLQVSFPDLNLDMDAEILVKDKRNDLAILKLDPPQPLEDYLGPIPYSFAPASDIKVGQKTFVIGFPLGSDLGRNYKVTTGVVSALSGVRDEPGRMQISNPIQPGNSGGPVFNERGQLVGVVVAGLDDKYYYEKRGFVPQNVNFAVKLSYLQGLMDLVPDVGLKSHETSTDIEGNVEDLVEQYRPFVVSIRNYLQKRKEPSAALMDPKKPSESS